MSIRPVGRGKTLPEVGRTLDEVIGRVAGDPVGIGGPGVRIVQDASGASISGALPEPGRIRYLDCVIQTRRIAGGGSDFTDDQVIPAGDSVEYKLRIFGTDTDLADYYVPANRFHRNGPYHAAPVDGLCRLVLTFDSSGDIVPRLELIDQEQINGGACVTP